MSKRRSAASLLVATLLAVAVLGFASPAPAVDNPDYTSVPPTTVVTTPQPSRKVSTAVEVTQTRSRLAITGGSHTVEIAVATALILAGSGLLLVRRRFSAAS